MPPTGIVPEPAVPSRLGDCKYRCTQRTRLDVVPLDGDPELPKDYFRPRASHVGQERDCLDGTSHLSLCHFAISARRHAAYASDVHFVWYLFDCRRLCERLEWSGTFAE